MARVVRHRSLVISPYSNGMYVVRSASPFIAEYHRHCYIFSASMSF